MIFSIACPIRGDVSSIAYGQEMKIGRVAQIINNFERGGLLSGDSVRINRIYDGEITLFTKLSNDPQRVVEVAFQGNDFCSAGESLQQFTNCDLTNGQDHSARDARARCIGRGGSRRVPC